MFDWSDKRRVLGSRIYFLSPSIPNDLSLGILKLVRKRGLKRKEARQFVEHLIHTLETMSHDTEGEGIWKLLCENVI